MANGPMVSCYEDDAEGVPQLVQRPMTADELKQWQADQLDVQALAAAQATAAATITQARADARAALAALKAGTATPAQVQAALAAVIQATR